MIAGSDDMPVMERCCERFVRHEFGQFRDMVLNDRMNRLVS